jgi:hypothetical protein
MVGNALAVDRELRPQLLQKIIRVEGNVLHVTFQSSDLKLLRTATSSFFDYFKLAARTIGEFA